MHRSRHAATLTGPRVPAVFAMQAPHPRPAAACQREAPRPAVAVPEVVSSVGIPSPHGGSIVLVVTRAITRPW